ncbi:MAG: hypothetical protein HY460_02485 [Parcubacteria group bacterium]|nr:hypothetical protein [Parcubacteria group bacterium]
MVADHTTNISSTALDLEFWNETQTTAAKSLTTDYIKLWLDDPPGGQSSAPSQQAEPEPLDLTDGADLAENYLASDVATFAFGEVVRTDPENPGYVVKTAQPYDPLLLGVISESPGLVIGEGSTSTVTVALAGRVPVKVGAENGLIRAGDMLTSSSQPGVAMRASKAGPIIGWALEDQFDEEDDTVLMAVRNGYYTGGPVFDSEITTATSTALLLNLLDQQESDNNATSTASVIITDRVVAGLEVVTPALVAQGLTIDSIGSNGDAISILSDTIFFGRPYFTTDTAGFAVVKQGEQSVEVAFEREYIEQPIVNATITHDTDAKASGEEASRLRDEENAFLSALFENGISYAIVRKSEKGFAIVLNKPAPTDIAFSWIALAVKGAKTFQTPLPEGATGVTESQSGESGSAETVTSPSPSPTPQPEASSTNTESTASTVSPEPSPTPEISSAPPEPQEPPQASQEPPAPSESPVADAPLVLPEASPASE